MKRSSSTVSRDYAEASKTSSYIRQDIQSILTDIASIREVDEWETESNSSNGSSCDWSDTDWESEVDTDWDDSESSDNEDHSLSPFAMTDPAEIRAIVEYTTHILEQLYDPKSLYGAYIKQLIWEQYPEFATGDYCRLEHQDRVQQLERLRAIPLVEQRSEQWYALKTLSIGASEASSIFGWNPYASRKKLIVKKCGHKDPPSRTNPACQHGIKYERIVQQMYSHIHKKEIYEFGSIQHPTYPFLSASPDGITDDGIMIEIKVPMSRAITGIPPCYYWVQMQQQLQVCGLDRVDFVECRITEYMDYAEYASDVLFGGDTEGYKTASGNYKGVIMEVSYKDPVDPLNPITYLYPPTFLSKQEMREWIRDQRTQLDTATSDLGKKFRFSRLLYWKCEQYVETPVFRDDAWWTESVPLYIAFWEEVQHYKRVGYQTLLPTPRVSRAGSKKDVGWMDDEVADVSTVWMGDDDDTCMTASTIMTKAKTMSRKPVVCLIEDDDE